MKTSTLTILASSIVSTNAMWKGFNLEHNVSYSTTNGPCKTEADWADDIAVMQSLENGPYNAVRVFYSAQCDTLANIIPPAIDAGIAVLAGVWTNDGLYDVEKAALLNATQKHGCDWLAAISVGSEGLWRQDETPDQLVQEIEEVRSMMATVDGCSSILIGHIDTWTAWLGRFGDVSSLINATDFLGHNDYPYYDPPGYFGEYFNKTENNSIENAYEEFFDTYNAVVNVSQGKPVWITETGWAVKGPTFNQAVAGRENAAKYWKSVGCKAFSSYDTFWYILDGLCVCENLYIDFAVYDRNTSTPLFDLSC